MLNDSEASSSLCISSLSLVEDSSLSFRMTSGDYYLPYQQHLPRLFYPALV